MIQRINWTDFDGDTFQRFCNDLLSFEFGANYIPFSAPGADQGIDGLYEGEYQNQKGKWRFQAKFKHPETGRTQGVEDLKRDIKKDLANNVKGESHTILITNVEIKPNKRAELLNLAEETNNQVNFDIWDGSKIHILLTHHSIVRLWYTKDVKHLILEYSEFYKDELNKNIDSSYDMSNKFYYREDKLLELENFIEDKDKIVAVINGETGVGKTRLCVEFFKQYIDKKRDWTGLAIINHSIDFETLKIALTGTRNYIVLLDDIDTFDERDIADLIYLAKNITENKVKFLFTVRNYLFDKALGKVTAQNKTQHVLSINLEGLSKKETVNFLQEELKIRTDQRIYEFAEMTRGVPIMIIALLKIIDEGRSFADIKRDNFLKEHLANYFNQLANILKEENEVKKRDFNKVLNLIALIEPIAIENTELIQQIAKTESISEEEVEVILKSLKTHHVVTGKYNLAIKPDMYSDLLLEEAANNTVWIKTKLREYALYTGNIIQNLGYATYSESSDNLLIENLLSEYIKRIETCTTSNELSNILKTAYVIATVKPLQAMNAVNDVIGIFTNQSHPLYGTFQETLQLKNYSYNSVHDYLKAILKNLFRLDDYYASAYMLSGQLYEITKQDSLVSNIANFNDNNRLDLGGCEEQNKILEVSRKAIKDDSEEIRSYALKTLKAIFKLEYSDVKPAYVDHNKIQIHSFKINETEDVKALREGIISLLIDTFYNNKSKAQQIEILKTLVDVPREIFANRGKTYQGKDEIEIILNFLLDVSQKDVLELKEKQHIKDQVYWYKRWGMDEKHHTTIDKITENLSGSNLDEVLMDLFHPQAESRLEKDWNKEFKTKAFGLIEENTGEDLGISLAKTLEQSDYTPVYYYTFLNLIAKDIPKNKILINFLWNDKPQFILNHCHDLLRELRFNTSEEGFYWEYINRIRQEESSTSIKFICRIYDSRAIHNAIKDLNQTTITTKDSELIISMFQIKDQDTFFDLAWCLPSLFYYDKDGALETIKSFMDVCHERHLDNLFIAFDPVKERYDKEIKQLAVENTIRFNIPYHIEMILNKIIIEDGFDTILNYFKQRFDYRRKHYEEGNKSILNYYFVPNDSGGVLVRGIAEEQRLEIFKQILDWFINTKFDTLELIDAKKLIELFAIDNMMDEQTSNIYKKLIELHISDYKRFTNIIKTLSEFKNKNELLLELIIMILELSFQKYSDKEHLDSILVECHFAVVSVGVKSGTAGEPFPVDLELKSLFENILNSKNTKNPRVKDFFTKQLRYVQSDIQRSRRDRGGNEW